MKVRLLGSDSIWDFALFFAAGFLPFSAFQTTVMRASQSIIDNKGYIKKVPFPSEIFPVCATLSESINLLIGIGIYLVLFMILKGIPYPTIVMIPLIIILQILFSLSFAFFLSAATVFFRDIPQVLGSFFLILFWATPIAYTPQTVPQNLQWILIINPIYHLLEMYRDVLLFGIWPNPSNIILFSLITGIILIGSLKIFKKVKGGFSELL